MSLIGRLIRTCSKSYCQSARAIFQPLLLLGCPYSPWGSSMAQEFLVFSSLEISPQAGKFHLWFHWAPLRGVCSLSPSQISMEGSGILERLEILNFCLFRAGPGQWILLRGFSPGAPEGKVIPSKQRVVSLCRAPSCLSWGFLLLVFPGDSWFTIPTFQLLHSHLITTKGSTLDPSLWFCTSWLAEIPLGTSWGKFFLLMISMTLLSWNCPLLTWNCQIYVGVFSGSPNPELWNPMWGWPSAAPGFAGRSVPSDPCFQTAFSDSHLLCALWGLSCQAQHSLLLPPPQTAQLW